jgi:hypothetical protein
MRIDRVSYQGLYLTFYAIPGWHPIALGAQRAGLGHGCDGRAVDGAERVDVAAPGAPASVRCRAAACGRRGRPVEALDRDLRQIVANIELQPC